MKERFLAGIFQGWDAAVGMQQLAPDAGTLLNQTPAPGASLAERLCLNALRWRAHSRNVKMNYKLSGPALMLIMPPEPSKASL